MTDILQAARSYYGMEGTPVGKCEMYTNEHGSMRLVIEIPVTGDDFIAIGERMKAMQEAESHEPHDTTFVEGPTVEAMREAYNALSKAEKGRYGSFARYMAESSNGIADLVASPAQEHASLVSDLLGLNGTARQVVHFDAPEEPEPVSMDAVWIRACDIELPKHAMASDWKRGDDDHMWCLMNPAMLTDEQKAKAKEAKP